MIGLRVAAAAVVCVSMVASAGASSVQWLNGHGGLKTSHSFNLDEGATLNVTAGAYSGKTLLSAKVGQYSNGLGVTNGNGDAHFLDGDYRKDVLFLNFSKPVKLVGLIFSYVDHWDDVVLTDGKGTKLANYDLGDYKHGFYGYVPTDEDGTMFGVKAKGSGDNVKLLGVKYHAVPSPAAAGMGLMGLLGLVARRRRRAA